MKIICLNIVFICFLSKSLIAQTSLVGLTLDKAYSFYDKNVVKKINDELNNLHYFETDTAFVYIDDHHYNQLIESFLVLKNGCQLRVYYLLFKRLDKTYIRAELDVSKINLSSIAEIYKIVNDSSMDNIMTDTILTYEVFKCNFYFKINQQEKEISHSSIFLFNKRMYEKAYFFTRQAEELSEYFTRDKSSTYTKPEIIKSYNILSYNRKRR